MPAKKLPEGESRERERIGRTIRAIRLARGLSVDEVANRISGTGVTISRPFLANIELGNRGLPRHVLEPLADALGCEVRAIVRSDYYTDAEEQA